MSVPFNQKLSYLFARVTGKKYIYSSVYESETPLKIPGIIVGGSLFAGPQTITRGVKETSTEWNFWVVAKPVDQKNSKVQIYVQTDNELKKALYVAEKTMPSDTVPCFIALTEGEWISEGKTPLKKQPFKKLVNTLKIPGVNGPVKGVS